MSSIAQQPEGGWHVHRPGNSALQHRVGSTSLETQRRSRSRDMNCYSRRTCLSVGRDGVSAWTFCPFQAPSAEGPSRLLQHAQMSLYVSISVHIHRPLESSKHPCYLHCRLKCVSITVKAPYILALTCSAAAGSCVHTLFTWTSSVISCSKISAISNCFSCPEALSHQP